MAKRYNPKKLTLIEILVVVFLCLFVLSIVAPAANKSRSDAFRAVCADNLSHISRAMLIYTNDYEDKLPRAGGRNSVWSFQIPNWSATNRIGAYGANGSGRGATISSSLYLLVKYVEVMPKTFICPGDTGTTEFNLADYEVVDKDLIELWDFGPEAYKHCSYAYHLPYGLYALTMLSEPGMAVAADRNPWIVSPAAEAQDMKPFNPEGGREAVKAGNALAHKNEGQNVLFLDGHVSFEESPACGFYNDNIYTFWDGGDVRIGGMPSFYSMPQDRLDSLLVHDPPPPKPIIETKIPDAVDSTDLKQTSVVATLDCPMPEHQNIIWCSTFQIAWDKLKNDMIGEPVKVIGTEELAARLNHNEASTEDLEEESFYSTVGFVGKGIIEQIQKEMKKRFPLEPVPVFNALNQLLPDMQGKTIVSYSFLNVDVGFKHPFFTKESAFSFEDSNSVRSDVKAFCAQTSSPDTDVKPVREQVEILYYKHGQQRDDDEFAVDLCKNTEPYQVILARVPRYNILKETLTAVEEKISEFKNDPDYEVLHKLRTIDRLTVPDILYKLTHQFTELNGKPLANRDWPGYFILESLQMIDFALSRTGVTIKSWAHIIAPPLGSGRRRIKESRYFYFNRPFLVYVKKRQGDTKPFFVMWVDNAELMKKF